MSSSGTPAPAKLEPAYNLNFVGFSDSRQREQLELTLSRHLKLTPAETRQRLAQPPVLIGHSPAREILARQQARLAQLGGISRIDAVLKYRHWNLPAKLMQHWETVQAGHRTAVLALLQACPAPGYQALFTCQNNLACDGAFTLNRGQLLLDISSTTAAGAGKHLLDLQQALSALLEQHGHKPKVLSALALVPQDGNQLEGLLDHLQGGLSGKAPDLPRPAADDLETPRPAAGRAWAKLVKLGPPPGEETPLSPTERRMLEQSWPLLQDEAEPAPYHAAKAADILSRYQGEADQRASNHQRLMEHLHKLEHLPSLPSLTLQVYQLAQSGDSDIDELARMVSADPGLSSRVLSVVNSTYYGLRQKVDSVPHAMVILGFEELAHLALLLSTEKVFSGLNHDRGQRLWRHSAMTAEVARALANRLERPEQATAIYTAALLHDIGKVLQYAFCQEAMSTLEKDAQELGVPLFEMELEHFGTDHASLGAALLQRWGLPEHLCHYVEEHHTPLPTHTRMSEAAAIIGVADHLAHRAMHSETWAEAWRLRRAHGAALQPRLDELQLSLEDLLEAQDRSPRLRSSAL